MSLYHFVQHIAYLDHHIFAEVNSLAHRSNTLDGLYIFGAVGLAFLMAIVLVIYWFVNQDKHNARKAIVLSVLSSFVVRFVFVDILRAIWSRNRPFITDTNLHPLIELLRRGGEPSFPSGHASAMFAIALSIYFYNRRLGFCMFLLAITTAICRIIVGVHYPSDIIGGIIVGLSFAYLIHKRLDLRIEKFVQTVSKASDSFFG